MNTKNDMKVLILVLCLITFYTSTCYATISGYVKDTMGNPVTGAMITFTDESNPVNEFSSITNVSGRYEINELVTNIEENVQSTPKSFVLQQNYPNPFNPTTTIPFSLDKAGSVDLTLYNVLGQKVRSLVHGYHPAGSYAVIWNGRDDTGKSVGAGIYIYQLRSNSMVESRKMLLLDGGNNSITGGPSYVVSNDNVTTKPAIASQILSNTTYHVSITGDTIESYEKNGITLINTGPTVDFFVSRIGSGFHISILHTNDVHSHLMPINNEWKTVTPDIAESFGSSVRVATMSRRLRNQRQNVLMLDAGDQFTGTDFYTVFKGQAEQMVMNLLEYDYMTVGNHEFDDGISILADFISGLDFPVITSNLNIENEPLLNGLIVPYAIREFNGRKVGIVGFVTTNMNVFINTGDVVFKDIATSVQNTVDELEEQDVNIIIALSHAGYWDDMEIAAKVDGIDIIVGGHSHTLLSNTDESAWGPYPTVIESPSDEPVLIVQAQCWNRYLGCLNVTFDDEGSATYWSGDIILMDNSVPFDEIVMQKVMEKYLELEEFNI